MCADFAENMKFFTDARCSSPINRTIQTAVLIETLTTLGAEVTWSSCVRTRDNLLLEAACFNLVHTRLGFTFRLLEHLLHPGPCRCRVRTPWHDFDPMAGILIVSLPSSVSLPLAFPFSPGRERPRKSTPGASSRPLALSRAASLLT